MTDKILWCDIESRSQCDLTTRGQMHYFQHPSTELIMVSYAFDDGPVKNWCYDDCEPFPFEIIEHIQAGGILYAHNAAFERGMFDYVIANDFDFDPPKLEQWRCSAARALAHGLPAKLADLCRVLELPTQKMTEGTRLIKDYCAPGHFLDWKTPADRELMIEYCNVDVITSRLACTGLRELDPYEWEQYHINEQVNDRGVPVDVEFAQAALEYGDDVRADVNEKVFKLTDGRVDKASRRKTRDEWLREKLTDDQLAIVTKKCGKITFDQAHRDALKAVPDLPEDVWQFTELVDQAGGSTIAKYKSMVRQHVNGRVHGSLIFSGAGGTGRWSSRGLQLQNFKRDVFKDPEPLIRDVIDGYEIDNPADSLGRLIRSAIHSKQGLTFSDYAQIEARVLPWLSGDPRAEKTLDIFRQGRDVYTENAVPMFYLESEEDVTPDIRQGAKMGVLACGFGGGKGAVIAMGRGYGINYSEDQADDIKNRWRTANPWAEPFWYSLRDAAKDAYHHPGVITQAGRLKFMYDGGDWLWMMLPSGRCLAYYKPAIEKVTLPWGDEDYDLTCVWGSGKPKVGEKWPRRTLNHLILAENATQATAADLMRIAYVNAEKEGIPVLFTVHDELVAEGHCADHLTGVMERAPAWAEGLPIKADTQESYRYGK